MVPWKTPFYFCFFTLSSNLEYLYMDTVKFTNTNVSETVKTTDEKPSANIDEKPTIVNKKPAVISNVDKKPVKNRDAQLDKTSSTKSKDLRRPSPNQSVEDRIIVEDFKHGTSVDIDELERFLSGTHIKEDKGKSHKDDGDESNEKEASTALKNTLLSTLNNDLVKSESNSDKNVSDSDEEARYIYQKEIKKRQRKEIRDKKKAEKKAYIEQCNGYINEGANYSQYPPYQSSNSQYPPPQYSQYQYPESQYPQSQFAYSQYLQYQYDPSQYSQSQYYPPQYIPSQAYTTNHMGAAPEGQYMDQKETEKQRRKRLREQIKAGKKAKQGSEQISQYADPRDRQELQRLEKREEKRAIEKAQRKNEKNQKKIEESTDPEFVQLMMDIDKQIQVFINDESATSYQFEPLPVDARRHLHVIAALYGLRSKSHGGPNTRRNVISKTSHTHLPDNRQRIERHIFTTPDAKLLNKTIGKLNAKGKPPKEVAAGVLPLDEDNLGHRMLSAMGWKQGDALGNGEGGITAPIRAVIRQDRKGLGS
ncbi:hypothetical protein K501DRAFT_329009 [Backusella circina FSU 941]|nr:hypothetical protein K501DRAFT_329009 [Backusella circina FSU 941]